MNRLIGLLSSLVSIYMTIIFIRIILTWFTGFSTGGLQNVLAKITDPYLNWFRRFSGLRVGFIDLSPIVALGVLSLVNSVLSTLARYGSITIGIIIALVLQVAWSAVSFFLGFLIIVLVLRLIGHLANANMHSTFWRIVDTIARPILFRITRIVVRNRIVNFQTALILSIAILVIAYIALRIIVALVFGILVKLPF